MSGPIIRKYGFPNFEKIFGARAPQHGIDDAPTPSSETPRAGSSAESTAAPETDSGPEAKKPESQTTS
jgi:hypothetical protein